MSPQQCLRLGSGVGLSAALRGEELAIITTSNVAFTKIQTLCVQALLLFQRIVITTLWRIKEINENLGSPHHCNIVLHALTYDVNKLYRRLKLEMCKLLQHNTGPQMTDGCNRPVATKKILKVFT